MHLRALALTVLLAACGGSAPGGTLGLPSERASSAPPAPRTPAATVSPSPSRSASPSPSPAPSASLSARPSASGTAAPTVSPSPTRAPSASPSPSPTRTPDTRPAIVSVTATQTALTVVFSGPMRTTLACGTTFGATDRATSGSIDDRTHYRSGNAVLDEALQSATLATINGDCAAVTFQLSAAAAAGTFTIAISGVQDRDGDAIAAGTTARVTIADEGRPRVLRLESSGDAITIAFSEPMQIGGAQGAVTAANYRLDGNTPAVVAISCMDAGCRAVRLALRAGTLVTGRSYELRIANLVDRAGRSVTPDPTIRTFVAG